MKDVERYWDSTLQALSYWVAYKQQYYSNSLLPEGAIVAELTQLLSSNVSSGLRVECEKMYKDITGELETGERVDIVIGKRNSESDSKGSKILANDIYELIEVKRYEGSFKRLVKDMEKLAKLNISLPNVKKYLVVVGQKKLPKKIFTESHNVRKKNIYEGEQNIEALPRKGKKAFATKAISLTGAYAAIIEIL